MKIKTNFNIGDTVLFEKFDWASRSFIPAEITIERIQIVAMKTNLLIFLMPRNNSFGFYEVEMPSTNKKCKLVFDIKNKKNGGQGMNIKTKFNVGDTVWIIKFDFNKSEYVPEAMEVDEIAIHIRKNSNTNIIYFFPLLPRHGFYDDKLYASKEACQKSCDKKNKMGRR